MMPTRVTGFSLLFTGTIAFTNCGAQTPAQTPTAPSGIESPINLETATGVINGSLLMPAVTAPCPVALIIAGSGPTDRNGNGSAGKNNCYQMLAKSLAAANIATVRYDKRGIAASAAAGPKESDLRFENYVDDAAAWITKLQSDKRFSRVIVIGHSEGSLIGALAVVREHANAFVSIAGPGRPAAMILREQLNGKLSAELFQANENILRELESGRTVEKIPPQLQALYRPSVQPYIISWFKYNPAQIFATIQQPILICQGTTDIQVAVEEADALKAAAPTAQLAIVQGMNHVLKSVPADTAKQMASYQNASLPIDAELVKKIVAFIQSVEARTTLP